MSEELCLVLWRQGYEILKPPGLGVELSADQAELLGNSFEKADSS